MVEVVAVVAVVAVVIVKEAISIVHSFLSPWYNQRETSNSNKDTGA